MSKKTPIGSPHVFNTCVPNQLPFVFLEGRQHRLTLGREALWLQGFPISIIDDMSPDFKDGLLNDLAGNMVSVPVCIACLMSTMASVSWACEDDNTFDDDPDQTWLSMLPAAAESETDDTDDIDSEVKVDQRVRRG